MRMMHLMKVVGENLIRLLLMKLTITFTVAQIPKQQIMTLWQPQMMVHVNIHPKNHVMQKSIITIEVMWQKMRNKIIRNIGHAWVHLGQYSDALNSYEQAVVVAEKEWGAAHIKTLAIKHSLEEARQKASVRRSNPKAGGGGHGGANASPLDAVLNPNSASAGLSGFRQSGIKTTAKSPMRKASMNGAAKAYGSGANVRNAKAGVSESWGEYLNETHAGGGNLRSPQGRSQLPPIGKSTYGSGAGGTLDDSVGSNDDRRGPRTPTPPLENKPSRPRR